MAGPSDALEHARPHGARWPRRDVRPATRRQPGLVQLHDRPRPLLPGHLEPREVDARARGASVRGMANPFDAVHARRHDPAHQHADLAIYDLMGREVRVLVRGVVPAGVHRVEWDGHSANGRAAGAGIYFARLKVAGQEWTRTVVKLD